MTAHLSRRSLLGLAGAGAGAYLLSACSGDEKSSDPNAPQTINWWHIQNTEPMLPVWAAMANEYKTAHSNVTIKIQPLENEAFKTKLTTATQAGDPPDLFQSWGGGVLKQQVDAGLVKDLTDDVQRPGRRHPAAPPCSRTRSTARSTACRSTSAWSASGTTRSSSPSAGITATAHHLGRASSTRSASSRPPASPRSPWPARTSGPAHYYWAYLAMRIGGLGALQQAADDKNFDTPRLRRRRRAAQGTRRPAAVPEGLPRRRVRLARTGRPPPWATARRGHGADGPVGAGGAGVQLHQQEGPRRQARLLPVPGRGRRQGRGHRGVRRRRRLRRRQGRARPRPSTSSSSCSAPTTSVGRAKTGAVLPTVEGSHRRHRRPQQQGRRGDPGQGHRLPALPGPGVRRRPSASRSTTASPS